MKITKTLRQVVSLVVVGAALAFTGSAAHAQSSGGSQPVGVEGNCPRQCDKVDGCAYCRDETVRFTYDTNGNVTGDYSYTLLENTGSGSHPDCLDCNGDCKPNAVTYYFTNNDCLMAFATIGGYNSHTTHQCQVKWAIATGTACPGTAV